MMETSLVINRGVEANSTTPSTSDGLNWSRNHHLPGAGYGSRLPTPESSSSGKTQFVPDASGLSAQSSDFDTTGQIAPPGTKPRVTATLWEDEGSLCFQVEIRGICVARREDNHMVNGTKLLNVAGMTRGRRDGMLKSEKVRHVVKIGPMHLKGVWIPFERALHYANAEKITELLYPLFVHNIGALLYHPVNQNRTTQVMQAAGRRQRDNVEHPKAVPLRSLPHPHDHPADGLPSQQPPSFISRPLLDRAHTFPTPPASSSTIISSISEDYSYRPHILQSAENHKTEMQELEVKVEDMSSPEKDYNKQPSLMMRREDEQTQGNYPPNTVTEALEIARDSPDGASDPVVSKVLESTLEQLWGRVTAQPESYIMSRDEFAVFNFYQHRFVGNKLAFAARMRFWDNIYANRGPLTADSVSTRTSSVSENEGTIYDGTTWYGPTWLSTTSDMVVCEAYLYNPLESEAVKKVIHAFQEHQGNSDRIGGPGSQSWSPSPSASQTGQREGSKRKLGDDQTQRDQGPVAKKGRKQVQDGQPRLACHFQKMDPVKWARCGMREAGFARISDIKQHFRRHHMRDPNYCPICGVTFPSEELKNDHIRQSRANPGMCPERSTPHLPDGLSHDKLRLLTERVKASFDISEQWYSIWAILFPDVAPPPAYTYDLSDRLHNSVRDLCLFLGTEGPAIGQSVLEQENVIIGPSSAANVDLADFNMESFTRRVLSRVFNETVQSWIAQESSERSRQTGRRLDTGSAGQAIMAIPLTPVSGSSNSNRVSTSPRRSTPPG
ncbi:hypothetical protein J7T55_014721 [Diaporthe amygdali]|uniref:uncharacterized protein n=1 Tax=Phomopsis amygdali TaxID=1214568 RepID=UPI0022FE0B0A|nr:uncharacterized protein J7T55_014721 [Diaporthe amygdali]KAJ0109920.1 hypothetical protein J7T55_014721 [Diaporthe amygdali]